MKQTNTINKPRWIFPLAVSVALIIALCFTASDTYAKKNKGGFTKSGYRRGRGAAGDGIAGSPKSSSNKGRFTKGGYRAGRGAAGDGIAGSSKSLGDGRGSVHLSNFRSSGQSSSSSSSSSSLSKTPFLRRGGKNLNGSIRHFKS